MLIKTTDDIINDYNTICDGSNVSYSYRVDGSIVWIEGDDLIEKNLQEAYLILCQKIRNLQIENDMLKSKLDEVYYRRGVSY